MAGIILNRNRQVPAEETPAFGGIAERFRRAGDLDRAIALCREGLKRFPDQLSARVTLGWSFLDKGQYDAARFELEQVLRKAPDNLAAIRGLAELHDRTEGALPPEHERSWRTEEPAVVEEVHAQTPEVQAVPDPTPAAAPYAPLHVNLGQGTPEILHTAAHAEMAAEAAASVHVPMSLDVAPVELEGLADASMAAAASEPAPFFVVDPAAGLSLNAEAFTGSDPAPFEVLGPIDAGSDDIADLAFFSEHGFDAHDDAGTAEPVVTFDAGFAGQLGTPDATAIATGGADEESLEDWAELAALAAETDAAAEAAEAPGWDAGPTGAVLELATAEARAIEQLARVDANPTAAPETLDDIDELAGQDIADAIKALEDAAWEGEGRFAIRPATDPPVESTEAIAAFDFGHTEAVKSLAGPEAVVATADISLDGSFELVAPSFPDLAFADHAGADALSDTDELAAAPAVVEPTFDFDGAHQTAGADAGSDDVDVYAEQSAADVQPAAPRLEHAQTAFDVVAQAPIDATADLLLASIETSKGSLDVDLDVDDVAGSVSIASGDIGPEDDSAPVDLLGSLALHPAHADMPEAAAGFSAGDAYGHDAKPLDIVDVEAEQVVAEEEDEQTQLATEAVESAAEVPDLAQPEAVQDTAALDVIVTEEAADAIEGQLDAAPEELAEAAAATLNEVTTGPEADVEPGWEVTESSPEPTADIESESQPESADADLSDDRVDEDLPLAALVAIDTPPSHAWHATAPAATAPATVVYDAPVFLPLTGVVTTDVATFAVHSRQSVSVTPRVGHPGTSRRSSLKGLERFLRQVQARRLELMRETVA